MLAKITADKANSLFFVPILMVVLYEALAAVGLVFTTIVIMSAVIF